MSNLTGLCAELKNYFCTSEDKRTGIFTISGGILSPADFLQQGQYFRIVGSVFNDGVYQTPPEALIDEEFSGAIWAMSVPPDFIQLAQEIEKFNEKLDAEALEKIPEYTSESYPNGYSYSVLSELPAVMQKKYQNIQLQKRRWRKI